MMSNFNKNIDKLVSRILNEEIESKVKELSKTINEGEWTEIEMEEDFKDGRKKIDVAEPKGKITSADFKKLRDAKSHKKEVEEFFFDNEDEEIEDAEELSQQEPTYVGKGLVDNKIKNKIKNKIFGSFDDEHGWFDNSDRQVEPDFDYDEEEEFLDFPSLIKRHGHNQRWFDKNDGEKFFNRYKQEFGDKPFRVRIAKGLEEDECNECGDKMYESKDNKNWIQNTKMHKGALHKKLGIPEGDKIPNSKLQSLKKELMKKGEGDKKLSAADSKLLKQVNLALTLKSVKESTNSLKLTEEELIDMIETLVIEQKIKDIAEKNNISTKEPQGLKKTNKVLDLDKKENDDYSKEVVKKMKDYMKDMFMGGGEYNENPDDFPQSNYQMDKDAKVMKYNPSDAVDEYIDNFSYPGMTNLVYDEIKPDDEMIGRQMKGDSKNGNAVTGKDGKALGNVSKRSLKVGEKFKKNFDENLYGAEQMNVSYKRQSQPVDVAGENKEPGSLKSKRGGGSSTAKAQNIMNKLESVEDKKLKIVSEEMNKMKNLISYDRKTQ
jgi:hypothetical protein